MNKKLRNLAILLLDDSNGIREDAYMALDEILIEIGSEDICDAVESSGNRFYLGENDAELLQKKS